jgi:hypothetical protein
VGRVEEVDGDGRPIRFIVCGQETRRVRLDVLPSAPGNRPQTGELIDLGSDVRTVREIADCGAAMTTVTGGTAHRGIGDWLLVIADADEVRESKRSNYAFVGDLGPDAHEVWGVTDEGWAEYLTATEEASGAVLSGSVVWVKVDLYVPGYRRQVARLRRAGAAKS